MLTVLQKQLSNQVRREENCSPALFAQRRFHRGFDTQPRRESLLRGFHARRDFLFFMSALIGAIRDARASACVRVRPRASACVRVRPRVGERKKGFFLAYVKLSSDKVGKQTWFLQLRLFYSNLCGLGNEHSGESLNASAVFASFHECPDGGGCNNSNSRPSNESIWPDIWRGATPLSTSISLRKASRIINIHTQLCVCRG